MREKKWKKSVSAVVWLLVCILSLMELKNIFVPKWTDDMAPTLTVEGFYAEKRNSLDVIFFGTSQAVYGFSPMELYENTGIKSYVCGTGSQSIVCTYYWVREALKYQHPIVIVLDTMGVIDESILDDGAIHCALDYMRFSPNKVSAVMAVDKNYDFETSPLEYFMPILKYHDRWKELTAQDFSYQFQDKDYFLKGHHVGNSIYADTKAAGITVDHPEDVSEMQDYQREYLQKIIDYCKKKDVKLVLTKTALPVYSEGSHNAVQKIADENGVTFLDYNLSNVWKDADMNYLTDFSDLLHLNINGATKTTRYMGDYLLENCPELVSTDRKQGVDQEWEDDLKEYQQYLIPQKEQLSENIKFWQEVHANDTQ